MNATGDRNAVWGNDIEFHAMLIHLGQLRWSWHGECKGAGGLPFSLGATLLSACRAHLGLLFKGLDIGTNLIVGRQRDGGSRVLLYTRRQARRLRMLSNRAQIEAVGAGAVGRA